MQKIEQLLTNWLTLTLENPLYAGVLILTAWILTSLFYHFRIHFLKKEQRKFEEASHKIQGLLDEAQQLSKENTEKVTLISEQMEEEQKSSTALSIQVEERNHQVVESIKKIAGQFNLSEQLVASDKKPKPEFVWQQQDNIQTQLADALQQERDEKTTLQASLDEQASHATQLEKDLNAQRSIQHIQTGEVDQKLIELLSEHEKNVSSLINGINDKVDSLVVDMTQKTPLDHVVSTDSQEEPPIATPEPSTNSDFELAIHALDTELKTEGELEPEIIIEESIEVEQHSEQEVIEPAIKETLPSYSIEELNSQFDKEEPEKSQKEVAEESHAPQETATQATSPTDSHKPSAKLSTDRLKGLFGRMKKTGGSLEQQTAAMQPLEESEGEPDNKPSLFSKEKMKGLLRKGKNSLEKEGLSQPTVVTPELNSDDSGKKMNWGKEQLTGLLSKRKKTLDKTTEEANIVATEKIATHIEQGAKAGSKAAALPGETLAALRQAEHDSEKDYEPDYAESNLHVFEKIKSLFGK